MVLDPPIERHAFQILQQLTQSLASERVGINVAWEVLGREIKDDPEHPEPSPLTRDLRRLVLAADLLESPVLAQELGLDQELGRPMFSAAKAARDALLASIKTLGLVAEEQPLADTIAHTLCLWHLANRQAPRPMTLDQLAQATLTESSIYGSPKDAVLAIAVELAQFSQVEPDEKQELVTFKATAGDGPDPALIFLDYQRRPAEGAYLYSIWREALTSGDLRVEDEPAIFAGMERDRPVTYEAEYGKVNYRGEYVLASEWSPKLGELDADRKYHWRVVYLDRPTPIAPAQLCDPRVAVVLPAERTEVHADAIRTYAAYRRMREDMEARSYEPEALRCLSWLREDQQRTRIVGPLLRAQREVYRAGEIVTREQSGVDPRQFFGGRDAEPRRATEIAARVLADAYRERPFAAPQAGQPIRGAVPSQLFAGLFTEPATSAARDAARNYAPALGLSRPDAPSRVDAGRSKLFELLRGWLK